MLKYHREFSSPLGLKGRLWERVTRQEPGSLWRNTNILQKPGWGWEWESSLLYLLLVPPIGRPQAEIDLSSHDEKLGSGSIVAAKTKIWGSGVFVVGDMFCPLIQGSLTTRIQCLMIWDGTDVIIEIKCIVNVMCLNHPPPPIPVEKLSCVKLVPGARKTGDHCFTYGSITPL